MAPHPIIPLVCARYRINQATLLGGRSRRYEFRRARHVAMYLLHTKGGLSYQSIAKMFDCYSQTVADACVSVEESRDDPAIDGFLRRLEEKIDRGNAFLTSMKVNPCVQGQSG